MKEAFSEEPCWLLGNVWHCMPFSNYQSLIANLTFLHFCTGDSGYRLEPWVILPILDAPPGSNEEKFTKRHCHARNCVERCIGVLKSRFRCLLRARMLHYTPLKAAKIVKACAVLHNMCVSVSPISEWKLLNVFGVVMHNLS